MQSVYDLTEEELTEEMKSKIEKQLDDLAKQLQTLESKVTSGSSGSQKNWRELLIGPAVTVLALSIIGWLLLGALDGRIEKTIEGTLSAPDGVNGKLDDLNKSVGSIKERLVRLETKAGLAVPLSGYAADPLKRENQEAVKVALQQAVRNSTVIPSDVLVDTGTSFIKASDQDPGAWDVVVQYLNYRSATTKPVVAVRDARPLAEGSPLIRINTGPPPRGKRKADILYFMTAVAAEQGARYEIIGENLNGTSRTFPKLMARNGALILDNHHLRHVLFENVEVHYSGGPLILEDVTFVNCTFVIQNTAPSRKLSETLLVKADSIDFKTVV